MQGESIFDLWRCINGGQIGGQTSIFHPHFALGSHAYLNISPKAYSDIETLNYHHSITDKREEFTGHRKKFTGHTDTKW